MDRLNHRLAAYLADGRRFAGGGFLDRLRSALHRPARHRVWFSARACDWPSRLCRSSNRVLTCEPVEGRRLEMAETGGGTAGRMEERESGLAD
jgi:hypothetical protein